jgi:hypothetical protein
MKGDPGSSHTYFMTSSQRSVAVPPSLSCLSFHSVVCFSAANMMFSALLFAAMAEALPQFGGSQGYTMLLFGCAQTVIDRIDPLVNPGQAPSPHMHQVAGGNAFNVTMQSTDISKLASCTTCGYSEDVSSAWWLL